MGYQDIAYINGANPLINQTGGGTTGAINILSQILTGNPKTLFMPNDILLK